MNKVIFFCAFLLSFSTVAQTDATKLKRLIFGVNVGAKFANRNYAVRYTGIYQNQLENFLSNPNTVQRVRELLGNNDYQFDSYSDLYRFQPALTYGVNIGFQASPNLSFEADLNFTSIRMLGAYNLIVNNPDNFTTQENFVTGNISGAESRFNGRISGNYKTDGDKVSWIFGVAGVLNAWRMESNQVELNGSILVDLFNRGNPANGFTSRVQGTGFGYGVNLGFEVPFKKGIVMQIVYQPYVTRMDYFNTLEVIDGLGPDYIKPPVRLEHDLMARFIWRQ